mgnify:CR=1 FL=1|tara:strand:- start:20 stop:343 length:324 start_codon:yes stop_codon:yes gene_type:complete
MKAIELRVGNLVFKGMDYFEADYITIGMAHNYEPIPLTEEWLVKFGFVENSISIGSYAYLRIEKDLTFAVGVPYESGGNSRALKHVHQLQNLYFALTGTELELKTNK